MVDVSLSSLGGAGWQFFDNSGKILAGGRLYTYLAGSSTPAVTYTDSTGNTANGVYVQLDSAGRPSAEIWLNNAYNYKFEVRNAAGVSLRTYDNIVPISNLAALVAPTGAGQIGYVSTETFPADTVGESLQYLDRQLLAYNYGVLPAGTSGGLSTEKTFSANISGTSDFRSFVERTELTGTNSIAEIDGRTMQIELKHTAGTVSHAYATKSYGRLGLLGSSTGDVTTIQVNHAHVAHEGTGTIGGASCYTADNVDLFDGTGILTEMYGFTCADQGHATRVPDNAIGYSCSNMTAGAARTAAFWSQMVDGTNKWAYLASGGAPSAFTGKVRIGDNVRPVNGIECVAGYAKFSPGPSLPFSDPTGNTHEFISDNEDYTLTITNAGAVSPFGVRVRYSASAPNNSNAYFFYANDTVGLKCAIDSRGNGYNLNGVWGTISDRRLKTKIKPARSQIADVMALKLRNFEFKKFPGHEQIGFIAQEVEQVSPGLVSTGPDGTKAVSSSLINLKLFGAFQEAVKRIEALEAAIKMKRKTA